MFLWVMRVMRVLVGMRVLIIFEGYDGLGFMTLYRYLRGFCGFTRVMRGFEGYEGH